MPLQDAIDLPTVLSAVAHAGVATTCTVHILLTKESTRSALGWAGLVWLSPVAGVITYLMLGINRVARKGSRIAQEQHDPLFPHPPPDTPLPDEPLPGIRAFIDGISGCPLTPGHQVTILESGESAYPAMIEAIDGAQRSVGMQVFLLDRDPWGRRFLDALTRAHHRGVEVRLLIDGVGSWFSMPPPLDWLLRCPFPWARFLWTLDPRRMALLNLRNHRKVLVVDNAVGFTGGMNVRGSFVREQDCPHAHRDLHARIDGPAVADLFDVFAADWSWTTGERLDGPAWRPAPPTAAGDAAVRVIPDGPDEHLGYAEWTFLAGLACATRHVRIATPYFLPEEALTSALASAARRGVRVDIVVPAHSNQPLAHHAMLASVPPLLDHGVHLWADPGPFDHAKILTVDDAWSVIGSANWDPRSLRLNFELNTEIWDPGVAATLGARIDARIQHAERLTAAGLRSRPFLARLRDGLIRLLSPYL